jgi:hypothetical protein
MAQLPNNSSTQHFTWHKTWDFLSRGATCDPVLYFGHLYPIPQENEDQAYETKPGGSNKVPRGMHSGCRSLRNEDLGVAGGEGGRNGDDDEDGSSTS